MNELASRTVLPVRDLPPIRQSSPRIVRVLDQIRFELKPLDGQPWKEEYSEFAWFAREYPRCYRYHLECAEFRLRTIHSLLVEIHKQLALEVPQDGLRYRVGISDFRVERVYWDFESYLSEISIALDLLARIVGTAYPEPTPPNFSRFCKKPGNEGLLGIMKRAKARWVSRLKDYRDCFTHYTPVDTLLFVELVPYKEGFELQAKLPVNPNVREILGFRYSRRVELFRYASSVWKHMMALDRAVAKELRQGFVAGNYPQQLTGLFYLGRRQRQQSG